MSFTTVELTGTVLIAPGVYANGAMVTAVLSAPITDGTTTVEPFTVSAICDSSGAFSGLSVYANDDNTTLPVGTYYNITIAFSNQQYSPQKFQVIVPNADAPTVDLFSLAQLGNAPAPSNPYVISVNGQNGVVTLPGLNGDVGQVILQAWDNTLNESLPPSLYLAPKINPDFGYTAQAPFYGSDWSPLLAMPASEEWGVLYSTNLPTGLPDTIDINSGIILVWNQSGTNLLQAHFTIVGLTHGSGPGFASLTQDQLIGTDLSITGGAFITSAAGGSYNIQISAMAGWD